MKRPPEPYTFAGKDEVHLDIARPQEKGRALGPSAKELRAEESLKDSVAAHQAECGCHPTEFVIGSLVKGASPEERSRICCTLSPEPHAFDSSGQPWHIDPLCKVRPGGFVLSDAEASRVAELVVAKLKSSTDRATEAVCRPDQKPDGAAATDDEAVKAT